MAQDAAKRLLLHNSASFRPDPSHAPQPTALRHLQPRRQNRRTPRPLRRGNPARFTHPPAAALRRPLAHHPHRRAARRRHRTNPRRSAARRPHPAAQADAARDPARRRRRLLQTRVLQLLPQPAKSLRPRTARPLLRQGGVDDAGLPNPPPRSAMAGRRRNATPLRATPPGLSHRQRPGADALARPHPPRPRPRPAATARRRPAHRNGLLPAARRAHHPAPAGRKHRARCAT